MLAKLIPVVVDPDNENSVTFDDNNLTYTFTSPLDSKGEWQTNYQDAGEYNTSLTVSDGEFEDSQIVKITVKHVFIPCYRDLDCGVARYSKSYCSGSNVLADKVTYKCINPGTPTSDCVLSSSKPEIKKTCSASETCLNGQCFIPSEIPVPSSTSLCNVDSDCGTPGYVTGNYCSNNNVVRDNREYICFNSGTDAAFCSYDDTQVIQITCSASETCSYGQCLTKSTTDSFCYSDSNCGISSYIGGMYCSSGNVHQMYRTYTCLNGGTSSASCIYSEDDKIKVVCAADEYCKGSQCFKFPTPVVKQPLPAPVLQPTPAPQPVETPVQQPEPKAEPKDTKIVSDTLRYRKNCFNKCTKRPKLTVNCPAGYNLEDSWQDIRRDDRFNTPCSESRYSNYVTWKCESMRTSRRMKIVMDGFVKCVKN